MPLTVSQLLKNLLFNCISGIFVAWNHLPYLDAVGLLQSSVAPKIWSDINLRAALTLFLKILPFEISLLFCLFLFVHDEMILQISLFEVHNMLSSMCYYICLPYWTAEKHLNYYSLFYYYSVHFCVCSGQYFFFFNNNNVDCYNTTWCCWQLCSSDKSGDIWGFI